MFSLKKFRFYGPFCFAALLIAATLLSGVVARAQNAQGKPMENRFLFVVDTSSAMERSAPAAQRAILDLLQSGIQNQLRPGDTLGVWTYNEKLNTGFPMQRWSEDLKESVI